MTEVNSSLNGNTFYNIQHGINISNFGFIASPGINKDDQWKRINLGFGWNQLYHYDNGFLLVLKILILHYAELIIRTSTR